MAIEHQVLDLSFKNTDTLNIPQFAVVMYDTTNAFGVVMPGSVNAGPVAGVSQSRGSDANGVLQSYTAVGQSTEVRVEGVSRAIVNGATVIGAPLSAQNTSGQVGPGAGPYNGGLAGYGMEAGGIAGDIISLLVNPGLQPALKQLGTVAAPLTSNGSINTTSTHAHGLGYVPHILI